MHVKMPEELLRSPFFTLLDETRLSRERSATETNSGTVFVGHDADSQTLPTGAVEIGLGLEVSALLGVLTVKRLSSNPLEGKSEILMRAISGEHRTSVIAKSESFTRLQ